MSDVASDVVVEAEKVPVEPVVEEVAAAPAVPTLASTDSAPAEEPVPEPAAAAPVVEEPAVVAEATKEIPVTESVEKVVDEFENMTIFGNKSLNELHQIQSKKSHLSAGAICSSI